MSELDEIEEMAKEEFKGRRPTNLKSRSEIKRVIELNPNVVIKEIEKLREALEYYADECSYNCIDHGDISGNRCMGHVPIYALDNRGDKARAAIGTPTFSTNHHSTLGPANDAE